MQILLIEDEANIQMVVGDYLSLKGNEVTVVTSGQEGWRCLQADPTRFAAVITDLHLPDLRGTLLVKQMRDLAHETPVLVIGGDLDPETVAELEGYERCMTLPKPFKFGELEAKLTALLME
ncbi:MAG TPA: response regulator [Anaerolineae bacterium]|nr:response regulator [Anaerolineae bacterium]